MLAAGMRVVNKWNGAQSFEESSTTPQKAVSMKWYSTTPEPLDECPKAMHWNTKLLTPLESLLLGSGTITVRNRLLSAKATCPLTVNRYQVPIDAKRNMKHR